MYIPSKAIYIFSVIPSKLSMAITAEMKRKILKFIQNQKAKIIENKQNWKSHSACIKRYYKEYLNNVALTCRPKEQNGNSRNTLVSIGSL